ncbi:5190_t:CDS:10, partial [Ambispora gerdemannii]
MGKITRSKSYNDQRHQDLNGVAPRGKTRSRKIDLNATTVTNETDSTGSTPDNTSPGIIVPIPKRFVPQDLTEREVIYDSNKIQQNAREFREIIPSREESLHLEQSAMGGLPPNQRVETSHITPDGNITTTTTVTIKLTTVTTTNPANGATTTSVFTEIVPVTTAANNSNDDATVTFQQMEPSFTPMSPKISSIPNYHPPSNNINSNSMMTNGINTNMHSSGSNNTTSYNSPDVSRRNSLAPSSSSAFNHHSAMGNSINSPRDRRSPNSASSSRRSTRSGTPSRRSPGNINHILADQSTEIGGGIAERDPMSISTTNLHLDDSLPININDNSNSPSLEDPLLINSEDSIPSFIDASNLAEESPPYLNASSPTGDAASFMDISKLTETPLSPFMKSANSSENSNSTSFISPPTNETPFLRQPFTNPSILIKESSPSFNNNTSNKMDDHRSYISASSSSESTRKSFMNTSHQLSNISETSDNTTYASYIPPSPRNYETTINSYNPPSRSNFDNTPVQDYNESAMESSLIPNDPYNESQGLLDDITSPTSSGGTLNSVSSLSPAFNQASGQNLVSYEESPSPIDDDTGTFFDKDIDQSEDYYVGAGSSTSFNSSNQQETSRPPSPTPTSPRYHRLPELGALNTVYDVWNEWHVGLDGNPSVEELLTKYGSKWASDNSSRLSRRRKIIKEIKRRIEDYGNDERTAINSLEKMRAGKSDNDPAVKDSNSTQRASDSRTLSDEVYIKQEPREESLYHQTVQSSSSSSRPISVLSVQNVPHTPRASMNLSSQVPITATAASINNDVTQQQSPPNIEEFLCPICLQIIKEAFMGRCGHSFCYVCIVEHLDRKKDCPTCGAHLMRDQIFPNFLLNRLLEKATAIAANQYESTPPTQTQQMKEKIMSTDLSVEDIDTMLITLLAKKHKMESAEKELELDVLADFLSNMKSKKEKKLELLTEELECIDKDLEITHEKLKSLGQQQQQQSFIGSNTYEESTRETSNNYIGAQVPNDTAEADVPDGEPHQQGNARNQSSKKRKLTEIEDSGIENNSSMFERMPSEALDQKLSAKKKRVREHFEDLESCYLSYRLPDTDPQRGGLSKFSDTLNSFTRYGQFRLVNTLRYGDLFGSSSIVSSIEFDRDDEYFATAGVTKKIKIFEYGNIERQLKGYGLIPSLSDKRNDLQNCLSWNTYIKAQIASADYDGVVSLWDVNTGLQVMSFDEHEKRAWSVDFSRMDPTKLASGSDDTKVKIWSTTERHSIFTIESKANICCVKFNPDISHYIAFGSADHHVHYYDLRHTREPVFVYKGHRKAVSYVKFMGSNEFVSASTDSTLRLWDTNTNSCARTFTGHINEKNFVGLTTTSDWIACGSEDNSVFAYYKNLCQPVVRFNFGSINNVTGEEISDSDASLFVSSVCWKKNSNTVLAANSQ